MTPPHTDCFLTSPSLNSGTRGWEHFALLGTPPPALPSPAAAAPAPPWLHSGRGEGSASCYKQAFPSALGHLVYQKRHGGTQEASQPLEPLTPCPPLPCLRTIHFYLSLPTSLLIFQIGLLPLCDSLQQMASALVFLFAPLSPFSFLCCPALTSGG